MSALEQFLTGLHARIVKATGAFGGGTDDGSVLVLQHVGAKSGTVRETPLMFINYEGGYAVAGSANGAPSHPGWYHNLVANPDTTVTVDRQQMSVHARVLGGSDRDRAWDRFKALGPRWASYENKTDRIIPVVVLENEVANGSGTEGPSSGH